MDIKVKSETAGEISQNITAKGGAFAKVVLMVISGGTTNGVEQANGMGSRADGLLSTYQSLINRDGQQVAVLAEHFEEFDEEMGRQMKHG